MTDPFSLQKTFQHIYTLPTSSHTECLWFIFYTNQILLVNCDGHYGIPRSAEPPVPETSFGYSRSMGVYENTPCIIVELAANTVLPAGYVSLGLRESHAHIGGDLWTLAGRAGQLLRWRMDHRYCGRCGSVMTEGIQEIQQKCPECAYFTYPRLSPAVIMSITRGDSILLGRAARFPKGMYSTLAGFVEPGETLEEAVQREVREEVNIEIDNIRYFASQPWPFPDSLMVGFSARHLSGSIKVDTSELEDARWFTRQDMPRLPSKISISRMLIDQFLTADSSS